LQQRHSFSASFTATPKKQGQHCSTENSDVPIANLIFLLSLKKDLSAKTLKQTHFSAHVSQLLALGSSQHH